ncbi:MAG TPA: hypothetical protein DD415_01535 [Clostridiales bacterium]|nr:hypothetical protein [Clostridiales bacterium]
MTKNNCRNCGFYVEHYVNIHGIFKVVTGCGHCINTNLTKLQSNKYINNFTACELWQPKNVLTEKRMEDIKKALNDISNYLKEILRALKDTEV